MSQYPTLSWIARDYLAIQGSAVPSECAFSSGDLTATLRWNKLSAKSFECLQFLKSAYRNGHVAAAQEAVAHLKELWDDLGSKDTSENDGDE